MRSESDGWIVGVHEMVGTNRVHGAVCSRQVQMDQAVRLGQEQVQVLLGKKNEVLEDEHTVPPVPLFWIYTQNIWV